MGVAGAWSIAERVSVPPSQPQAFEWGTKGLRLTWSSTSTRVWAASDGATHLPGLRKAWGALTGKPHIRDQILKRPAFPLLVCVPACSGPLWPWLRPWQQRQEPGPDPSRLPPGRSRDSALTLVWTCQGAHLDLRVPSRPIGGAAAGLKGSPGAWKAQGTGQGSQHLGAGWEGAKGPSTAPSSLAESLQRRPHVSQTAPPMGGEHNAVFLAS